MERRSLQKTKTKLITNSLIELGIEEDEGKGKGRYFVSKFIEAGLAHYKELGDIVITKETLDKFIQTMVGCPVIIDHEDVNDKNVEELRVGVISKVWYNEYDGWYYCEGIITDKEAINLIKNEGWSVSCAYSFVSDDTKKTYHGKPIDMEFIDGEFLHLAIVKEPRYEGANIVVNKKDDDVEWITVKGNHIPVKKGQSKDEAVKEFLEDKKSDTKDKSGDSKEKDNPNIKKFNKEYKIIEDMIKRRNLEPRKEEELLEQLENYKRKFDKNLEPHQEEAVLEDINDFKMYIYKNIKSKANNNIGDITMTVLNDLTDFIKNVVSNEKEDEMKEVKNEDKRKLIDEIGGILKDKVDDEIIRTVIKKAEELSYEPSEDDKADNKKAKNEEDKDETKNKCKNEDDKKEDKKVEDEEEKEEDITKNKDEEKEEKDDKKEVKNSMKDFVMGGKGQYEEKSIYTSRAKRLEEGNKY